MTLAEYQTLTGNTVSETDAPRMKAILRRAETRLGSLLGYPLSRQKNWTELGKVQYSDYTLTPFLPVGDEPIVGLLPADDQSGDIQLFNYDELDKHIRINPAKEIYRVKVVLPVNEDEFVTVYEMERGLPYLNNAGLVVAITRHDNWFNWTWWNSLSWSERSNLMLAVEADYVNVCDPNKHPDLAYLLADMVDYYGHKDYSVMGNIRSESIDSHSYSRASTGSTSDSASPQGQPSSKKIIEAYAGPGAFRKLVR